MANYELNSKNLALLGFLDECHQLYSDIDDIYAAEFEHAMWPQQVQGKAMPKIRKLLDAFLSDKTYLFTQDYFRIHPNSDVMRTTIFFLETKRTEPLHIECSMASFNSFLKILQDFVAAILCRRKSHDNIHISVEKAVELIDENIISLIKSRDKSYIDSFSIQENQPVEKLIVFKSLSLISCNTKAHDVVSDWVFVKAVKNSQNIKLPVHICKTCGRTFIGHETLKVFEGIYGKLLVRMVAEKNYNNTYKYVFNGESELHQYGYNVVDGRMSEEERRLLLVELLKEKKMTRFQIMRDIENAIGLFDDDYRFLNAVSKWKSDLLFISEYSMSHA